MQDFEKDVCPLFAAIVNKVFADPDLAGIALVLAWYAWERHRASGKPAVEPRLFANFACRQVKAGRDLPGVRGKFRDLWDRADRWGGAGMDNARDPSPGPLERLVAQETLAEVLAGIGPKHRAMAELLMDDGTLGTGDLARLLGVTPGRVSQMRREVMERLD